jgi:hypothetical protein
VKDTPDAGASPFECVEPELGELLARYEDPGLEAGLRRRLDDHLTICDACRLERAIEHKVAVGLRDSRLQLPEDGGRARNWLTLAPPRRRSVWALATAGGLAVAASAALMLALPPTPAGDGGPRRDGGGEPRIVRPVEGEVVMTATPRLNWTPVPGATAYVVELSGPGGEPRWSGHAPEPSLTLPEAARLDPGRWRVIVQPVPADLAGPGDLTVSFRRAGGGAFLLYRIGAAAPAARIVALLGMLLLGASVVGAAIRGRIPSHG